jgi:hypothetical protein
VRALQDGEPVVADRGALLHARITVSSASKTDRSSASRMPSIAWPTASCSGFTARPASLS